MAHQEADAPPLHSTASSGQLSCPAAPGSSVGQNNNLFYHCRNCHRLIKATSSVLMTSDDVIVNVRTFVIARLIAASVLRIHVASFTSLLLCDSLSTTFNPSQSTRWFSVVVFTMMSSYQYVISTDEVVLIRRWQFLQR